MLLRIAELEPRRFHIFLPRVRPTGHLLSHRRGLGVGSRFWCLRLLMRSRCGGASLFERVVIADECRIVVAGSKATLSLVFPSDISRQTAWSLSPRREGRRWHEHFFDADVEWSWRWTLFSASFRSTRRSPRTESNHARTGNRILALERG